MRWFEHRTNAHRDPKIIKLIKRHGVEGYGMYFYCLELIAGEVGNKVTFELEHDAEVIAYDLKMDTLKVEEIMLDMVTLGLFENCEGRVTCMKLAAFLAASGTRNATLKRVIEDIKKAEKSGNVTDCLRQTSATLPDLTLPDITNPKNTCSPANADERQRDASFDTFWNYYPRKVGKPNARKAFAKHVTSEDLLQTILNNIEQRLACGEWNTAERKEFIPHPATWLNRHGWEDDITPPAAQKTRHMSIEDSLNDKSWA